MVRTGPRVEPEVLCVSGLSRPSRRRSLKWDGSSTPSSQRERERERISNRRGSSWNFAPTWILQVLSQCRALPRLLGKQFLKALSTTTDVPDCLRSPSMTKVRSIGQPKSNGMLQADRLRLAGRRLGEAWIGGGNSTRSASGVHFWCATPVLGMPPV